MTTILLVRAGFARRQGRPYRARVLMEPLGLALLAALTPPPFQVRAVDDRCDPLDPGAHAPDLVAISCCSFSVPRAYELADAFRARGIPVVLGGFHPTLAPDEAQAHADAVVLGDAEASWPALLRDFQVGCMAARYGRAGAAPLAGVTPDRSVYDPDRYLPLLLVQFGRGCRHRCEFCAIAAFHGAPYVHRPVPEVLEEIRTSGRRRVFFVDDNLMTDPGAFRELLEGLRGLGIRWSGQIDLGCADDPELLDLMRASGGQALLLGLETLRPGNLRAMGKAVNRPEAYRSQLARLRAAGFLLYGSFVFGYDEDREDAFDETARFAVEEGLFLANFIPLMPLPGTRLHARLLREDRLPHPAWWLLPGLNWMQPLVRPAAMSSEALFEGVRRARARFNAPGAVLRRLLGNRAHLRPGNLLPFLLGNALVRLDLRAKYEAGS